MCEFSRGLDKKSLLYLIELKGFYIEISYLRIRFLVSTCWALRPLDAQTCSCFSAYRCLINWPSWADEFRLIVHTHSLDG